MTAIEWLFGTARFVPHGVCLLWRPDLVALHVGADTLIALSYFAIPAAIWWFVRRRTDLEPEHKRLAFLFVAFIVACGLTHVAAVATLWQPYYGLQALIKTATAGVSVATALALPFIAPKLLRIPSARSLQIANDQLHSEVAAHQATLEALEDARRRLERKVADRDEDLRVVNARFRTALTGSPIALVEQDENFRYTWVFNSLYPAEDEAFVGRTEAEMLPAETAEALQKIKREALDADTVVRTEVQILNDGEGWIDLRVQPTTLRDGTRGLIACAVDITELKRHQAHLQLVMRELNHRSKNLLHIVQSIARQTAVGLDVPPAFMTRLGERLQSLAAAHDVLVEGDWRGADLQAVVESQLKHQIEACGERIRITGERIELAPEMAHYVCLAVHELGSNAAKYGALSGETGRVDVAWRKVEADSGDPMVEFTWRESGAGGGGAPTRRGFGRTILEVLTPRALDGQAELRFEEGGVVWTLVAPLPKAGPQS